jgi:hypothetical protein
MLTIRKECVFFVPMVVGSISKNLPDMHKIVAEEAKRIIKLIEKKYSGAKDFFIAIIDLFQNIFLKSFCSGKN